MYSAQRVEKEEKLYASSKLEDFKKEKIAFIIDLYEEIKNEEFLNTTGDKTLSRFEVITNEIENFVKVKDYFSNKTEFGLYTYAFALKNEIKFCNINSFLQQFQEYKSRCGKDILASDHDTFDLTYIYDEAFIYLKPLLSIETFSNSKDIENDYIIRFILFYNRSDIPVILSNTKDYNVLTFVRLGNFVFDVIFLRRKINNEDDKKVLMNTFNSFKNRPHFWYAFENSSNIQKFKYFMNLLLANPNQRIKLNNIEKFQKKMEELIKNFAPDT